MGNINWTRPHLKITTGQLLNLFEILKGDPDPKSKIQLTKEALKQSEWIKQMIQDAKVNQTNYLKTCSLIILKTSYTLLHVYGKKFYGNVYISLIVK